MPDETPDLAESEVGATSAPVSSKKPSEFYPDAFRSLSEDDLKSPAVVKMLISQNESNSREIAKLNEFEEKYYTTDKNLAVAQEKVKQKNSLEIFSDVSYSIGGILLALSTVDFSTTFKINNWVFIGIGVVLIFGGAFSKWSKI